MIPEMPTLTFDLPEELKTWQQKVREFAQQEIAPRADAFDVENDFPDDLWPKMGRAGLLAPTVDKQDGGAGLGYLAHALAIEEISRASASIGMSYGAHSNLCIDNIARHGTAEQKKRFLPKLISGEHVGALAMSEADAGSDVLSMQLRAVAEGDRFILDGEKMWITNGPDADVLIVYAKTTPEAGHHGITAFIIEKGFAGFGTRPKLDKLGMRGSNTCGLVFTGCEVPAANVLGGIDKGLKVLMGGLDSERALLAAGPVGIMQACLDLALPFVHRRRQFGKAIGEFQLIQAKLADIYAALNAARAYLYEVAKAIDRGERVTKDAAGVMLFASEKATWAALETIQILGGRGYLNIYPAGRLLRDAKLYEIGAGTCEIRRLLIGGQLFKESDPGKA
ncbi:MAG: isovaleryl-CoA dehydrogenase [Desulfuromonadales bacterium]|nr:isovaleryl-CoA dehydrogenase [Desulfuromonadales bacterium]NIR32953.1 isovaleryl-CoA dehydrogenase [Desulfuromonadales bacterium]NIS40511.1 isovaleryl-CoA dehydrogenase [Desulfuromonadales bacterium]